MKSLIHTLGTLAACFVLGQTEGCIPPTQAARDLENAYNQKLTECLQYSKKPDRDACKVRVNTEFGLCTPPQYPELQLCGETGMQALPNYGRTN
jgi:hypothetical protein